MNEITNKIKSALIDMSTIQKIEYLNQLKTEINKLSPQTDPVDNVQWVHIDSVHANSYNPNSVAPHEMQLLYESILIDGYTMPVVVYTTGDNQYEIVDGFHRTRTLRERADILERTHGYLPVVVINKTIDERMGSTIRHNRARGTHSIKSMSDIVLELIAQGWDDAKICEKLGMEREEVLRLKQISGLKEAFMDHEFSPSWNDFEKKYFPDEIGITKTVSKRAERK